jgi:hypothetical protein
VLFTWVAAAALLLTGLYAGGVFFVALAPTVTKLPPDAFLLLWQAWNADYQVLPPFLLINVVLLVVTAVLAARRGWPALLAATGATLLVVFSIVLTITQLVPLNEVVDTLSPGNLPADFESVRARWWALHLLRTAAATVAFVLLIAAVFSAQVWVSAARTSASSARTASRTACSASIPAA